MASGKVVPDMRSQYHENCAVGRRRLFRDRGFFSDLGCVGILNAERLQGGLTTPQSECSGVVASPPLARAGRRD